MIFSEAADPDQPLSLFGQIDCNTVSLAQQYDHIEEVLNDNDRHLTACMCVFWTAALFVSMTPCDREKRESNYEYQKITEQQKKLL